MKNTKVILPVAVLVIIIGVFTYSHYRSSPKSVHIGIISPLTGLVAGGDNMGQSFLNGAILAKEEYEVNHSLPVVDLISDDDGYDSKKGLSAYQKEVSIDKIDALINLSSPTIDVIKSDVQNLGIPVLQLGAESEIAQDNIFQIFPDQTAVGMLGTVANKQDVKTITVVMQQIKAYEKFISDFQREYQGSTTILRIPTSEKDYKPVALKIKELGSQGLVVFTDGHVGGQLLSRMDEIGYHAPHLYFDLNLQFGYADYKTTLGSSASRILNGSTAMYATSKINPGFNERYKARFHMDPGELSGYGYDAYKVMVETYNVDSKKWLANIQNYTGEGVTGKISFDSLGLRPPEWAMATYKDGEFLVK